MSLLLGAASTDRISHGSAASLDDLHQLAAGMTIWAWVMRTSDGTAEMVIASKFNGAAAVGWLFRVSNTIGEGQLTFDLLNRGTTNTAYYSVAGVLALNVWTFVAATFQDSASPEVDLYTGTLALIVTEVSYATTTDGAGTLPTENADSIYWTGNRQAGGVPARPFKGRIARHGVVNRALTLGELRTIQYASIPQCNVPGTVLLCDYYTGSTPPDLSGEVNNGTVTGASIANHVPLKQPYPSEEWLPYIAVAGGASKVPVFMNDYRRRRVN